MAAQDFRQFVRRVIRQYGIYVQVVLGTGVEPTYVYSVGFQRMRPRRPELILFGLPMEDGVGLTYRVLEEVRAGRAALEAGAELAGFDPSLPHLAVRLDTVRPAWVDVFAAGVGMFRNGPTSAVPCLQMVLPDRHGRWPDAADADPALRQAQPLLGRDDPWLAPVTHTEDPFLDHAGGDTTVAAPAAASAGDPPRWELLTGWALEPGRVQVGQVPWLADLSYGDVVEVGPSDGGGGVASTVPAVRRVVERGGYQRLGYEFRPVAPDEAAAVTMLRRLFAELDELSVAGQTRESTTASTVHVNSRDPDRVRQALRRFERDGLVAERHGRCNCGCASALRA